MRKLMVVLALVASLWGLAGTPAAHAEGVICGSELSGYYLCVNEIPTQDSLVYAEMNDYGNLVSQQKTVLIYAWGQNSWYLANYNQCGPQTRACYVGYPTLGDPPTNFLCWERATDAVGRETWAHVGYCPDANGQ